MSDYLHNQTVKYMSHEDDNPSWKNGQIRFINHFLLPILDARGLVSRILDAGCGDGAGLTYMGELGFYNTTGVDFSPEKLARASDQGNLVLKADLHQLPFVAPMFDVVYSSHALEHCHSPEVVVAEFVRVAKEDADFIIVVPFPDTGPEDAHCGSQAMGTRSGDLRTVTDWFRARGLEVQEVRLDSKREPEVWLHLRRRA